MTEGSPVLQWRAQKVVARSGLRGTKALKLACKLKRLRAIGLGLLVKIRCETKGFTQFWMIWRNQGEFEAGFCEIRVRVRGLGE